MVEPQHKINYKIIVGLGNVGAEYVGSRHNVGFDCVDRLQSRMAEAGLRCSTWSSKSSALVSEVSCAGEKVFLAKPQNYMNRSGESVAALARFYKIEADQVIVLHDEVDLALGCVAVKAGGGDAGHNGLKSITQMLGKPNYLRIRLGVGRPPPEMGGADRLADWVLGRFAKQDWPAVDEMVERGAQATIEALKSGATVAQQKWSRRR